MAAGCQHWLWLTKGGGYYLPLAVDNLPASVAYQLHLATTDINCNLCSDNFSFNILYMHMFLEIMSQALACTKGFANVLINLWQVFTVSQKHLTITSQIVWQQMGVGGCRGSNKETMQVWCILGCLIQSGWLTGKGYRHLWTVVPTGRPPQRWNWVSDTDPRPEPTREACDPWPDPGRQRPRRLDGGKTRSRQAHRRVPGRN